MNWFSLASWPQGRSKDRPWIIRRTEFCRHPWKSAGAPEACPATGATDSRECGLRHRRACVKRSRTMHLPPLVTTIAAAFTAAWVLGLITQRLRLSPIVGYLLAGGAIGAPTPGVFWGAAPAGELAGLGVVLLLFGGGPHFPWRGPPPG